VKAFLHEYSLHSTPVIVDDPNTNIATLLIESRRLKAQGVENRRPAATFDSSILRRFQYVGSHTCTAEAFHHPQRVNGKPAEGDVADKAAHHSTIRIANVHVQASPFVIPQVATIEFTQSTSNRVATLRLNLLGNLEFEGRVCLWLVVHGRIIARGACYSNLAAEAGRRFSDAESLAQRLTELKARMPARARTRQSARHSPAARR
jgi:hypothetical protein